MSRLCTTQPSFAVRGRRWSVRFIVWGVRKGYVQSAVRGAVFEVGKQRFGEGNPPFSWVESAEGGPRGRHRPYPVMCCRAGQKSYQSVERGFYAPLLLGEEMHLQWFRLSEGDPAD
jgi:hypothetical protein